MRVEAWDGGWDRKVGLRAHPVEAGKISGLNPPAGFWDFLVHVLLQLRLNLDDFMQRYVANPQRMRAFI